MSDHGYEFYMQGCTADGVLIGGTLKNLEKDFEGLRYAKCEGLEDIGAAKNIYEEVYSDADQVRVYIPNEVKNEATEIILTLYFTGDSRSSVRDEFNEYIRNGYHRYWDTARNKWFVFYVKDKLNVGESMWHGSTPYIKCEYKLKNIFGKTFEV